MKKIINIYKKLQPAIVMFLSLSLLINYSCKKDEEPGAPVITRVRYINPALADSSLTMAPLGATIVIQGRNFNDLQYVFFNGSRNNFNPTLVTNNNIVITLTDTIPTLATDTVRATGTILIITKHGMATYHLEILPPPPIIDSISNEFAEAGEVITLWGKYFYFVDSVIFPGNLPGTDVVAGANGASCQVKTPVNYNGATGNIIVLSKSGYSSPIYASLLADTASIFLDFDRSITSNPGWAEIYNTATNSDVKSIRGNYIYYFGLDVALAMSYSAGLALVTEGDYKNTLHYPDYPDNYPCSKLALEFEYFSLDPWNSGFFEIAFLDMDKDADGWKYAKRFAFNYPWKTSPLKSFQSSGGWKTAHIPINNFKITRDNKPPEEWVGYIPKVYSEIKGQPFDMDFKNNGASEGGFQIPVLSVAFDNFRVVKIN